MVTPLQANTAEVAHQDSRYKTGADGLQAGTDEDARETLAGVTHDLVHNSDNGTTLHTSNVTIGGVTKKHYTGHNIVADERPLVMDTLVHDAFVAGNAFVTGGQIPPTDFASSASLAPYLDMMFLVEASKKTGEKFF